MKKWFRWVVAALSTPPFVAFSNSWSTAHLVTAKAKRQERKWLKFLLSAMTVGLALSAASFICFMLVLDASISIAGDLGATVALGFTAAGGLMFVFSSYALCRHINYVRSKQPGDSEPDLFESHSGSSLVAAVFWMFDLAKLRELIRERLDELPDEDEP